MVKTGRFASTTMQTMPPPGWQLVPVGTAAKPKEPEKVFTFGPGGPLWAPPHGTRWQLVEDKKADNKDKKPAEKKEKHPVDKKADNKDKKPAEKKEEKKEKHPVDKKADNKDKQLVGKKEEKKEKHPVDKKVDNKDNKLVEKKQKHPEPVTKMIYEKRESIVEERRVSKVSGAGVVDVKKTHRMHSEMRVVQRR